MQQSGNTKQRFGDLLREAMGGMTVTKLAEALGVDRKVVHGWLSNARAPKLNSTYFNRIKGALSLDDEAAKRLREAQIATLSVEPTARPKRSLRGEQAAVTSFIERANRRDSTRPPPPRPLPQRQAIPSLPETSARGRLDVLRAAIALLERAAEHGGPRTGPILLSVQGKGLFEGLPDAEDCQQAWHAALHRALACGWEVEELWRLESNIERSLQLVESMLDLIVTGSYYPRSFKRYGLLTPPYDLIVVPGVGALLLLAADERGHVDGGISLTQPEQIALLAAHYALLRHDTQPLAEGFSLERQELEFTRALVKAEAKPGGRLFIMEGPSGLCMPLSWYEGDTLYVRQTISTRYVSEEHLSEYLALLRRRKEQFEVAVQTYDFRDICTQQGIREIAEVGLYPPDVQLRDAFVPIEMRLEHLRNLVSMLETHDRYQMALLDDRECERILTLPNRVITGLPSDGTVFLTTWLPSHAGKPTQLTLHITESTLVSAFRQHFEEAWERIAPAHKEKAEVLAWLRAQVATLERRRE